MAATLAKIGWLYQSTDGNTCTSLPELIDNVAGKMFLHTSDIEAIYLTLYPVQRGLHGDLIATNQFVELNSQY